MGKFDARMNDRVNYDADTWTAIHQQLMDNHRVRDCSEFLIRGDGSFAGCGGGVPKFYGDSQGEVSIFYTHKKFNRT